MQNSGAVDCHTHWGRPWTDRDGLNPGRWLEPLTAHGVQRAIVLPEEGLFDAGCIPRDNDRVAAVCAKSNGRMIPFCTVNVWRREEALEELRRCLEVLRMRGVKIHPWVQGCSVSFPVMDEVCEMAGAYGVPLLFHDGTPPFCLPSQMALLARRHPKTQVVLGHCGMFEHWREAVASLHSAPNLWGCLCSPHGAALREIIRRCDISRLVWGTDHGYGLADVYGYRRSLMDTLGMSDATQRAIFKDNPAQLLGR